MLVVWPAQSAGFWDKHCTFSKVFLGTENASVSENKSKVIISGKKKTLSRENNDSSEEIPLSGTSISCRHWTVILKYAANLPYHLERDSDMHSVTVRTGDSHQLSHNDTQQKSQKKTWERKESLQASSTLCTVQLTLQLVSFLPEHKDRQANKWHPPQPPNHHPSASVRGTRPLALKLKAASWPLSPHIQWSQGSCYKNIQLKRLVTFQSVTN